MSSPLLIGGQAALTHALQLTAQLTLAVVMEVAAALAAPSMRKPHSAPWCARRRHRSRHHHAMWRSLARYGTHTIAGHPVPLSRMTLAVALAVGAGHTPPVWDGAVVRSGMRASFAYARMC